jgi:hypothetical protein
MKADLFSRSAFVISIAGARKFRAAGLSSPDEEFVLTPRFLFHSFWLALAVALLGCSKDERREPCPRPEPSFRLQLTAEMGLLPEDTYLRVYYQGKLEKPDADPMLLPYEDYDFRNPPTSNVDVCCRTGKPVQGKLPSVSCGLPPAFDASVRPDAALAPEGGSDGSIGGFTDAAPALRDAASDGAISGSGSSAPEALLCDLWTNGPADIVVTGTTYPRLKRELLVEFNECGVVRRDIRVIWSRQDGGK